MKINVENLEYAHTLVQQLSEFKPESSFSFRLSQQGYDAITEALSVAEWGMGKNMPKMRAAVLEIFEAILSDSPGEPVNVNFTEYECKSLQAAVDLIERSLAKQKDGVLKK